MSEHSEALHVPRLPPVTAHNAPLLQSDRQFDLTPTDHDDLSDATERVPLLSGVKERQSTISPQAFFRQARSEANSAGGKDQGLPVRWQNLSVIGSGSSEALAPSLASTVVDAAGPSLYRAVRAGLARLTRQRGREQRQRLIINSSGVLEQGEMLLVLGRPSSGVTTLLRALASDWEGYSSVRGQLDYAGIKPKEVQSRLRGEACYLSEDDLHFPTLSTAATLLLALRAKTPSSRENGEETRKGWQLRQLAALARYLGLSDVLATPVGNEGLRGISGGERKRTSLAELLATRASVVCVDNATSGLDSSTAVASVSLLRDFAVEGKRTVIAGLRQVGEAVYSKFDKVVVLHKGRQVYFGPRADARAYFESLGFEALPGQTTADFLCACTDPATRRVRKGCEGLAPASAVSFERAYIHSQYHANLMETLRAKAGRNSRQISSSVRDGARNEKDRWTPASSIYTTSFFRQVGFLTLRQYDFIRADLKPYITKTTVNVALSLLVGTLFFQLPQTTAGAFTRQSVLLLALLFNGYLQLAELGNTIAGRPIVKRHSRFGFYSPSALALARTISDLPLIAAQVAIFATITYLLAGLQRSFERFIVYLLFVYIMALCLTSVFRAFAAFSPSINEAFRYCGVALNIFVLYGGFFIPAPSIQPWLRWIHYYIDPVSQAYEAVLANEFKGLKLQCSASDIVPRGPFYNDTRFQTCAFAGSQPGSLVVDGEEYLNVALGFLYSNLAKNMLILVLLTFVFLAIGVVATDYLHFAPSGAVRLFVATKEAKRRIQRTKRALFVPGEQDDANGHAEEQLLQSAETSETVSLDSRMAPITGRNGLDVQGATLTWRNLGLAVTLSTECRQLLSDVSGYIKPGEVTCLMGASGAGKTTLLNALAGRSGDNARTSGSILFDGSAPSSHAYRNTGYVEQLDMHDEYSTVREALEFSALLRQDCDLPREDKLAYIDEVLDLLDLTDLQDAIVGTTRAGLGLEQRKRLTIAIELVSGPKILFLDEPTSGLDTQSAHQIVLFMRKLASTGIPVLATIHQPSAEIFSAFDKLLLLERGGKQAFFGDRASAVSFFEASGNTCPADSNPAEFLLDAVGAGDAFASDPTPVSDESKRPSARWKASNEARAVDEEVEQAERDSAKSPSSIHDATTGAGWYTQATELTKRTSHTSFSYSKLFTVVIVSLIIGLTFLQQDQTIVGMQNKVFSVFLLLFIPPVFMNAIIQKVFALRALFNLREKPARIYQFSAFCTAVLLADLPYALGCGGVYFALWYSLVGLPAHVGSIIYSYGRTGLCMVEIFFVFQYTLALAMIALADSAGIISNLLPFFLVSMEAFNGSLIPYARIPSYWRWLYWVSPFQWYVKGVLATILHDQPVRCLETEIVSFAAPASQSCSSYASAFLSEHAGYLIDPAAIGTCEYCKFSVGDDFLATLNIAPNDRWLAMGIMLLYTVANVGLFFALALLPRPSLSSLRGRLRTMMTRTK